MRFTLPERIPTKREFLLNFYNARFPEVTGSAYTRRCSDLLGRFIHPNYQDEITGRQEPRYHLRVGSDMHRLMVEMARNYQNIYNAAYGVSELDTPAFFIHNMGWRGFDYNSLETTFVSENGSVSGWLRVGAEGTQGFIKQKHMAVALFYTYLMFCDSDQRKCRMAAKQAFEGCLSMLGMTDIEPDIAARLFDFSWQERGGVESYSADGMSGDFETLENTALVLFGTTALVLASLVERYNNASGTTKAQYDQMILGLQALIRNSFASQIHAAETFAAVEQELFRSVVYFEPRAKVGASSRYYPQDVLVMPKFYGFDTGDSGVTVTPMEGLRAGQRGSSQLIVAKTGYGKSIYLQSLILCLLHERHLETFKLSGGIHSDIPAEQENGLYQLARQMDVPRDMYVISVPARMYTACYKRQGEYKDLMEDFVAVYLTYMWSLLPSRVQDALSLKLCGEDKMENVRVIKDYLVSLASHGRLLLVLDSFDEVPATMRISYINALEHFCHDFCDVTRGGSTGSAHILLSSRQMSDATMRLLKKPFKSALSDTYQCDVFGISPLDEDQKAEFVTRWLATFKSHDSSATRPETLLSLIADNHYYRAYTDNPYMLSVMCQSHAKGVSAIATEFINTLIQRMQLNGTMGTDGNGDMGVLFNSVLDHIERYINEIAWETVVNDDPYITQTDLQAKFQAAAKSMVIPGKEVSDDVLDQVVQNLHELFVTQAGLIVPADQRDQDYQFINHQIRYELAAKCLAEALDKAFPDYEKVRRQLSVIPSCESYIEMMVRLLCVSPQDRSRPINWISDELLLHHLVTKDYENDQQGRALDEVILDLIHGYYGMNIMNRLVPGIQNQARLRGLQRMVLSRLVTSPYFSEVVTDMEAFLRLDVCKKNADKVVWLAPARLP